MSLRSSLSSVSSAAFLLLSLSAGASQAQSLDQMAERWAVIKTKIQQLDVKGASLRPTIKVTRKKDPFPHMIAQGEDSGDGSPPVRGYAFEERKKRIVIIQNLFGTSGGSVSAFNRVQFLEMLRSLLPRESFENILEIEVIGFSDIQSWGDSFNAGECNVNSPHNNACLAIARSKNTAEILREYTLRTVGSAVHVESRSDPDPIMNNLNVASEGKLWVATDARRAAAALAERFGFKSSLGKAMDPDELKTIRGAAFGAKFSAQDHSSVLQPFRCAILIAWRA